VRIDTTGFAFRARREAERYGGDAWVFVRELLQNARDAGAARVDWTIVRDDGRACVVCRDDGCGMTLDHARRYLFTLYASSKRGSPVDAGRFGVGFWSVLRFDPETVIVRSRTRDNAWQATLDGDLRHLDLGPWCAGPPGTEVELRRGLTDDDLPRRITEVVRRDAAFLRRRDRPTEPVEIRVDDVVVSREPSLPPPSMAFRRRGVRGVVGLGEVPQVDLFARGLRVRTATTLDELEEGAGERRGGGLPVVSTGLAPCVLVDADGLDVLAARGDARADRELRRVVRTVRRELDRLVGLHLDAVAPFPPGAWVAAVARRLWASARPHRALLALGAATVAVAAVVAAAAAGLGWFGGAGEAIGPVADARTPTAAARFDVLDVARVYDEPGVGLGGRDVVADMTYAPSDRRPWLAVVRRVAPRRGGDDGLWRDDGPVCRQGCLVLSTRLNGSGLVRLAEPTGWRVDPTSVHLDGRRLDLWRSASGEAVVRMPGNAAGRLEWRAGPGPGPELRAQAGWPGLPTEVERVADGAAGVPFDVAVERLESWVRGRVRYDRSPETVAHHRMLQTAGRDLFDRIIEIGAGDCDLQNALLAAMLHRAGVRSRMAVGMLGLDGRVAPGLHAWVEARGPDGRWRVADASTPAPASTAAGDRPRPRPTSATGGAPSRPSRAGTWLVAVVAGGLACAATLGAWRGRTRRRVAPAPGPQRDRLVRAALERPDALGARAQLGRRALVPTIGGRLLSTERCRELAIRRRIAACRRLDHWREVVGPDGPATVDLGEAAGREVAAALHIPVVDEWASLLDRAEATTLTDRLESALWAAGVRWVVRAVPDAPERAVAVVGWRRPECAGRQVVLVRADAAGARTPDEMLETAEEVCDAIGLDDRTSRRVLARVARDLLRGQGP